jgi:hypothetical protein
MRRNAITLSAHEIRPDCLSTWVAVMNQDEIEPHEIRLAVMRLKFTSGHCAHDGESVPWDYREWLPGTPLHEMKRPRRSREIIPPLTAKQSACETTGEPGVVRALMSPRPGGRCQRPGPVWRRARLPPGGRDRALLPEAGSRPAPGGTWRAAT